MAAPFRIGVLEIQIWQGPPPPLFFEEVMARTTPGVDGIELKQLGKISPQARVVVTSHWPTFSDANDGVEAFNDLPEIGPLSVVWNDIDYLARFGHMYTFLAPRVVQLHTANICGPDYNYSPGGVLSVEMSIIPHKDF